VRFWDSSALAPLLVREAATSAVRAALKKDGEMLVWALSPAEVTGALWRRRRAGDLDEPGRASAEMGLERLAELWTEVVDVTPVVRRARRLLAVHPLRAADALQLGAALAACGDQPDLLPLVTLDDRLAEAARREGFLVAP
jgi:predicted nucleic acid-binding protein